MGRTARSSRRCSSPPKPTSGSRRPTSRPLRQLGSCLYTERRVEGFWPIFFLLVVLKIPVFGALWLVWWASRAPEPETAGEDSDGGFKRRGPFPTRPRGPRHRPHGGGAAVSREEETAVPLPGSGVLLFAAARPREQRHARAGEKPSKPGGAPAPPPLKPAEQPSSAPCGSRADKAESPPGSCAA